MLPQAGETIGIGAANTGFEGVRSATDALGLARFEEGGKVKRLVTATAVLTMALVFAPPAQAQIDGSAHDFNEVGSWMTGQNTTTGEVCVFCHAPHNNAAGTVPLWNHATSASTSYSPYLGLDMSVVPGQPTGVSKLCLSCHDGVLAVDNYGGNGNTGNELTGNALFGTDLSNDHPISMAYTEGAANGMNVTGTDISGSTSANSGLATIADLLDVVGVQCSSCHDVHNQGPAGVPSLLNISNEASGLCLTCHIK